MDMLAQFLRDKAAQCRALAEGPHVNDTSARGMSAMALELEAQAVAIEAGHMTEREIEAAAPISNQARGESPPVN